jgi:tRNA pseudouridine(38-40) synthase
LNLLHERNIKLIIEYDGTNYKGWQTQAHASSIQSTIESSIEKMTGGNIILIGAGRTDSGVHAKGQVANFHTHTKLSIDLLPLAINAHLPYDIAVKSAEEVPLDFNARRDAKAREYMYIINNRRSRTALKRLYSYQVPFPLDIKAMKQAAGYFLGEHDFTGFMGAQRMDGRKQKTDNLRDVIARSGDAGDTTKQSRCREIASSLARNDAKDDGNPLNPPYQGEDSRILSAFAKGGRRWIRNIMKFDVKKKDDFLYITVKANSFLIHMVRYMVAALLEVGKGKMNPEDIKLYLEPSRNKWTHSRAPARGLFLMKVEY